MMIVALITVFAVGLAASDTTSTQDLVNYNLHTMRGYGKCKVELENAPIQFFHESFDGSHASGFAVSAEAPCAGRPP